jgi:hypothetical protein
VCARAVNSCAWPSRSIATRSRARSGCSEGPASRVLHRPDGGRIDRQSGSLGYESKERSFERRCGCETIHESSKSLLKTQRAVHVRFPILFNEGAVRPRPRSHPKTVGTTACSTTEPWLDVGGRDPAVAKVADDLPGHDRPRRPPGSRRARRRPRVRKPGRPGAAGAVPPRSPQWPKR